MSEAFETADMRLMATEPSVSSRLLEMAEPTNEVDRIYSEIFDAVIDHRLLPGVKLTEAVLCDVFRCSRGTVRAALARLAHDKIVELLPNRGAFVATPDLKETRDVFEARRMVEGAILDKLLTLPDLSLRLLPLRQMVDEERAAFRRKDRVTWIRLSNAFHVQLAKLADNEVLTDLMRSLASRTSLIIALYDVPGRSACSFDEHERILASLDAHDRAGVLDAMNHHLQDCERRLRFDDDDTQADLRAVFNLKR
ncbi:GntR family transcriptional regulator [Neisseriaceae bacterium JH1-16]|nr:GntR family transcriptional regulator [Neisseriaceae bacterium JH1-16]